MKNTYKISAGILLITLLISCEENLDRVPISNLTTGNYYQTEAHMEAAMAGMYNGMRDLFSYHKPQLAQSASDNTTQLYMKFQEGTLGISQYVTTTTNYVVLDYWQAAYQAIYRCNVLIEKSENVEFSDPALKERYVGEARFLRALVYFDMVRFFGGIPLMTELIPLEETYQIGRASKEEVWALIKEDLNAAIMLLPENDPSGRATKYAALGILADVHLNLGEYEGSKKAIDQVISSGNYELFEDFAEVYNDANNNGPHSIFAIQFLNQPGEGNSYPTLQAPKFISVDQWPFAGGGNRLIPSQNLWDAYGAEDIRRDLSIKDSFIDGTDGQVYNEFWQCKHGISNTPIAAEVWGINQIVMRYAEALLISAEVENKLGDHARAIDLINLIRNRAGMDDFTSNDPDSIHEEVYLQRRLELAFEDERWFDIQRSGKAEEILGAFTTGTSYPYTSTHALFPIPQIEIGKVGADVLVQNPGY